VAARETDAESNAFRSGDFAKILEEFDKVSYLAFGTFVERIDEADHTFVSS
jgi:hypothetical protein